MRFRGTFPLVLDRSRTTTGVATCHSPVAFTAHRVIVCHSQIVAVQHPCRREFDKLIVQLYVYLEFVVVPSSEAQEDRLHVIVRTSVDDGSAVRNAISCARQLMSFPQYLHECATCLPHFATLNVRHIDAHLPPANGNHHGATHNVS